MNKFNGNKTEIITEIKRIHAITNQIIKDNQHNKAFKTPLIANILDFYKLQLFNYTNKKLYKNYTIYYLTTILNKQLMYYKKLKNIGGQKMKNIDKTIELLQEMGRMALTGTENVEKLQSELLKKGYETSFKCSDREYLILTRVIEINKLLTEKQKKEITNYINSFLNER